MNLMLGETIEKTVKQMKDILVPRNRATLVLELNGLRVGEAAGGGDMHGLLANNVAVQVYVPSKGEKLGQMLSADLYGETCEVSLETSKTYIGRRITFVGTSLRSKVPNAEIIREWWRASGVKASTERVGKYDVTRAEYFASIS